MEYRIQSTGELKTQGEVRRMHSNTSLPKVWDANVCTALGIDPVLAAPKPETTGYTQAVRNGATQDANGNWVQAWSVVDMFADTTEDGVTHTKAEQEAEYQTRLDAEAAESVRTSTRCQTRRVRLDGYPLRRNRGSARFKLGDIPPSSAGHNRPRKLSLSGRIRLACITLIAKR
jgi:hypothetical protein